MIYNSPEQMAKNVKIIYEVLDSAARRKQHTNMIGYSPRSPWIRAIAAKLGIADSVYLTRIERQKIAACYRNVKGSLDSLSKDERPTLIQKALAVGYERMMQK